MGKFKKGLFLGTLLGAGLTWLNSTTKGKETRGNLIDHAEKIYPEIKDKILSSEAWKSMTKSKYIKLVDKQVSLYAKKYKLPSTAKKLISKVVIAQWNNLQAAIMKKK